ncbi:MAG: hypothetical protein WA730_22695, partial [Pseudolabrys sp.]
MLAIFQQLAEGSFPQHLIPALVSRPFVAALPVLIERIAEASRKIATKLRAALRLGLAPFFAPEAEQGGLIAAHDDRSPAIL